MMKTMTHTTIDPVTVARQIERFGSPLYLYDGSIFEARCRALRDCLPPGFDLYFAVKANPLLGVMQLFCQTGTGAEVSSEGELYLALTAGFSPQKIIYTCPGKTPAGLRLAIRNHIYCISLESVHEAEYVHELAEELHQDNVRVSIRVNADFVTSGARLVMSGQSTQFGIDEKLLEDLLTVWPARFPRLSLTGIQVYAGTQILDAEKIIDNADKTIQLAVNLAARHDFPLQCIDLGGGFGVPYLDDEAPGLTPGITPGPDLQTLKKGYARLAEKYRDALHGVRMIVESGRYLTAAAGQFITRVLSTKMSKGKKYIICDGGYSHHPASQPIRCQGRNRYPVQLLQPFETWLEKETVTVTGPTGTPVDILAKDILLPPVAPGDLLSIGLSGAYCYTNSCQLFFSSPLPAEIMLHEGKWHVLRKPGTLQQLINDMGKID